MSLCTCQTCHRERRLERLLCGNESIIDGPGQAGWAYSCVSCGNKRCPHHRDHQFVCTRSNQPNQVGQTVFGTFSGALFVGSGL